MPTYDPHTSPSKILKKYWGYDSFRPMQQEVIASILAGHDTLALMPTGGGKSLTFQVPGLMCSGICLVITPLVALMKDQVDALRKLGIKATMLHSGLTRQQTLTVFDNCQWGEYKFLYVSPERLSNATFVARITRLEISFIVVDESHCVSQWGYDFRPHYLSIPLFRKHLPDIPLLAVTATAPPDVVSDIMDKLAFRPGGKLFRRSFYRKALSYVVRETADKMREMLHILQSVPGSALVYVRNREKCAKIVELLKSYGISADYYHAGLSSKTKSAKQNAWQQGDIRVMVCTNAFGMGIDKNDVRLVIHPDTPDTPEAYYQEAGRAARDNKPAYAVLLYDPNNDRANLYKRLQDSYPARDTIRRIYEALCNFFTIAEGYGQGSLYEFDIYRFCAVFKLSSYQVDSALRLLHIARFIDYLEDHHTGSRLMITTSRNSLYDMFAGENVIYDRVLEALLRTYSGLFTEYAFIDERLIASRCNLSAQALYTTLIDLSRWKIIDYVPGKRSTFVRFLHDRLPKEQVHITEEVYEKRYKRDRERLDAMVRYVEERDSCRVATLLDYFGEEDPKPCGLCDYCRKHKHKGLTYRDIEQLEGVIAQLRHEGTTTISVESLAQTTELSTSKIREAMHFFEHEYMGINLNNNNLIHL